MTARPPGGPLRLPRENSGVEHLKIAMVAPPYFEIPPHGYGGVEAVVADLVDGLVARGHEISLIGVGTHGTRAQHFFSSSPEAHPEQLGQQMVELTHAGFAANVIETLDIDLVHDHTLAGPLSARGRRVPTLVTVHGALDHDQQRYYRSFDAKVGVVAISHAQRAGAPDVPWIDTVHNGVRVESFDFQRDKEAYVLFLGRFHPQKAPHIAIDAARAAGRPIVLAGKCIEALERAYFSQEIEPRLGSDVSLIGVADSHLKRKLLSRASCLVFPICWEEPFGLVMIEALASGTPVVALRRGAVNEILEHGRTAILADDPSELPAAIAAAQELSAAACRSAAASRFGTATMTLAYERAYRRLLGTSSTPSAPRLSDPGEAAFQQVS
ncbi:MAG: glycosyltransferase family 4 protein [Acidimicrobiales bacterium]